MPVSTFKYISENTGSYTRGFFFPKKELPMALSESVLNYPFGQFKTNVIEFSVYNTNDELLGWKVIDPERSYTPIHRTFVDLAGNLQSYSYNQIQQSFFVLHGEKQVTKSNADELVVAPVDDLSSLGLSDGAYSVVYSPMDNVVGNQSEKSRLLIKDISPSRKELKVVPVSDRNSSDPESAELNQQYDLFLSGNIKVNRVIGDILKNTRSPRISDLYYQATSSLDQKTISEIKFNYSFKSDSDLISFLQNTYTIIADQFENFLYFNYEKVTPFDAIQAEYSAMSDYVANRELKVIRNSLTAEYQASYPSYVKFIVDIFNSILNLTSVQSTYNKQIGTYFKNVMNFGNGQYYPILSWKVSTENAGDLSKQPILLLKLAESLPENISVKDSFWLSNFSVNLPIIQDLIVFKQTTIQIVQLRGPNFRTRVEDLGQSTKTYSFDSLTGQTSGSLLSNSTQKLLNEIQKNFFEKNINVDYRYFENFVHFSSAQTRLNNYTSKYSQSLLIDSEIVTLQDMSASMTSSVVDPFIQLQINTLTDQKNELLKNFDGYETFLYDNPAFYDEHSKKIGIGRNAPTSASFYDEFNDDRLINNTAEYIVKNPDNAEYLMFLDMIGQHFDLIWLYIKGMPSVQPPENRTNEGIAQSIVWHMLLSLGWDAESGTNNQDLLMHIFGEDKDENTIESMSGKDRTHLIWRRLLNNLPYIFKKKGTEEAFRALLTCYGVPSYIFKLREYGGIEYSTDITQDSLFIFDNIRFSVNVASDDEYLEFPWNPSAKALQFAFSFDTTKTFPQGSQYTLALCDDRWAVGVLRESGSSWGQVYFTSRDASGSLQSTFTERIPVFNGDLFSILLRKNDIDPNFDLPPAATQLQLDTVPTKYDLFVKRGEDARMIFEQSASLNLSSSYNTTFREGSRIYLGNYNISSGSTEAFFGTLDQIQMWAIPLTENRFDNHVLFNEAYDSDNPETTVGNLLLDVSFSEPSNLYSSSGVSYIENSAYNQSYITYITASNFKNLETGSVSSSFPWHFDERDTRETVRLPNFGANKFRSNKIRFEDQNIVSDLSINSRSTVKSRDRSPADSSALGLFFSPVDMINMDILRFFGNFDLANLIGNPAQVYNREYAPLREFIPVYFKNGGGRVDFQSYLNLVKAYFDKSLFKHLRSLAPGRSKFATGLLIEPNLLERTKLQSRVILREVHNNMSCSIDSLGTISSDLFPNLTDDIFMRTNSLKSSAYFYSDRSGSFPTGFKRTLMVGSGSNISATNNFMDSVDDSLVEIGIGAFAVNGSSIFDVSENGFLVKRPFKIEILKTPKLRHSLNADGTFNITSKNFSTINVVPSISGSFASNANAKNLNGYYFNHFKFKRDIMGKISTQTTDTTLDLTTKVENGSLPVEVTIVDRGSITVGTQGTGVILNTNN